jgi:hypothetical protein
MNTHVGHNCQQGQDSLTFKLHLSYGDMLQGRNISAGKYSKINFFVTL